jgi:cytochrome c5
MMTRKFLAWTLAPAALAALAGGPLTERLEHGKQVYTDHCASCHDTGKAGAPMLSRPGQWTERSDLWDAVLFEHAKQGYGQMPGGGDAALQEYDIAAAAEYIMSVVFPERATD